MIRFSIKWAVSGAVYAGVLLGAGTIVATRGGGGDAFGIGLGMFFGGAIALPLALTNLVSATAVSMLLREASFAFRFGCFALGSLMLYWPLLNWFDDTLRPVGGVIDGTAGAIGHLLFFAASLGVSLACMALRHFQVGRNRLTTRKMRKTKDK
ncbi:MAG: hypothetical protein WDN24_08525 [Sphingomonas sp.]